MTYTETVARLVDAGVPLDQAIEIAAEKIGIKRPRRENAD